MDAPIALTDSHRRRIGSLASHMRRLIGGLHQAGVDPALTAALEQRIAALEDATGGRAPERGNAIGGTMSILWVASCEVRARSLAGYGELGDRERRFFDDQAALLEREVRALEAAIARQASASLQQPGSEASEGSPVPSE